MLTQIHIRDFATIVDFCLHIPHGTTMITGETGSGKSIFIEAIEIALGGRANQNIIRAGKEKTQLSLAFDITKFPMVIKSLKENDLYLDHSECIIRRVISNDGRSRCYVNGTPVTVNIVKELGEKLFHLHGQHEQQVLLKSEHQREMLDRYADHWELVLKVKTLAEKWLHLSLQIKELSQKITERNQRLEYLNFQLEELSSLKLSKNRWETLENEHKKLSHSDELLKQLQHVLSHLSDEEEKSILSNLKEIKKIFDYIDVYEKKASHWSQTIDSTLLELNDLYDQLKNYLDSLELDANHMKKIEEELSQIFNIARKHKIHPKDLCELEIQLINERNVLNSSDENLTQMIAQQTKIENEYRYYANLLSQGRKQSALRFEKEITQTIKSLSLPHGEFKIVFEDKKNSDLNIHGCEKIIFLIKTNPDLAFQPLNKIISGGELSRLSLALHLALAKKTTIPILIFDEVDTGLSGATAEKIGKLLRKLGESYQVFCVTHQAQVAALGHEHLLVEKKIIKKTTCTELQFLNKDQKTREIARLLAGETITEKTIAHAKEVLQSA